MSADKPNPPRKPVDKPLSLHGMTPEDAIQQIFSTPLPRDQMYCPTCQKQVTGPSLIGEEGERRCPKCGTITVQDNFS